MVSWQLITLAVVLNSAWIYRQTETQQGFSKHNFWLHQLGLAIISLCLTLGLAAMPLAFGWGHLFLPVFLGWLLLECVKPSQRIHRKAFGRMSPQRQRQWLGLSLGSAIALLLLWQINGISLSLQLGLTLPLFCGFCSGLMAPFIRLRAWVLASLILFSSFGAVILEGTISQPSQAQTVASSTKIIKAGAYIIDMGQPVQTVANGLKPYGLVYELVVKKGIPVKWSIDPNKAREGTDFSSGGKIYKGGPFIIEKEFAADAAATVAIWRGQGVIVDGPTTADFTAPIYNTIDSFPNAVIDFIKSSIITAYYANAGIPASTSGTFGSFTTYRLGYPTSLTSCDDLFVLPHADPTWANHSNLIAFNQSKGFIWAACHAVSAMERLDDPTDADTLPDMNYLSHIPPAIQDSRSLKLYGTHALPTVGPYQYSNTAKSVTPFGYNTTNIWAYPIMQFLGKIDLATQNGSEQIYIPDIGGAQWRDETAIAIYDDNNTDAVVTPTKGIAPPSSQVKAVKLAYGPGFGNSNNGIVMYEAGHNHAAATGPDNIAAQRAFFNWILLAGIVRRLNADIIINGVSQNAVDQGTASPPAIPAGATVPVRANVSGGSGGYSYQWYSSCGGSFANATGQSTTFTAPTTTGTCAIRAVISDGCNRRTYAAFPSIAITGPQADLSILKNDGQPTVKAGAPIAYNITVTNNGPTTVNSLTVTDSISTSILNPVFTPNTGSFSYSSSTGVGTWTGLTLASGQSILLTLKGTVSSSATGILTNTASVAPLGGLTDPVSSNNSADDPQDTIQVPSASIIVTKDDGITQTNKDGLIVYTIKVTNNGPDPIASLQIEDQAIRFKSGNSTVDKGGQDVLDNLSLSVSKGTLSTAKTTFDNKSTSAIFTSNFGTLTWQNVNLAVGESATLTMSASSRVDETQGDLKNTVRLTPLNSLGTVMGTAVSASDQDRLVATTTEVNLGIVKTLVTSPSPAPGETIQYRIVVTNAKNTATNAIVSDNIPSIIQPLSANPAVTWTCLATRGSGDTSTACGSASGQVNANNTLTTTATIKNTSGSNVTYTVTGKIAPSATGTLLNTATVSPQVAEFDKSPGDNDSTHTLALIPKAALQVTKTDGQTFAAPGTPITYAITVKNLGPSVINSVKIADVIPKTILNPTFGVNTGTFSPTKTASTSTTDTWTGDWTNLSLIPGSASTDTVSLVVSGTLAPNAPSGTNNLVNTISVDKPSSFTGSGYGVAYTVDTANSTLTATDTDSIKPIADLSVTKTDNKTAAIPGQPTSYIITVTNNGPSPVSSLTLNDTLPSALLNPLFEPSVGTYDSSTKLWSGLTLQPTQSVTLALSGTIDPTATGTLTNAVTVAPAGGVDDPTPNDSDDNATDTTTLTPQVDLSIGKTDGNTAVNPGEQITYTIRVTNLGPSTVNSVKITDALPSPFTPSAFTPSTGTYNSSTGDWMGLTLKSGDIMTLTVTGTVSSSFTSGTLTNTATVSPPSGVTDPVTNNNSSTDTTTVPRPTGTIDLAITKTNNNTNPIVPGSDVNYAITITNNSPVGGPSIDNLTVIDAIPADLVDAFFASPYGDYDPLTGTLVLTQPLAPGESVTLLLSGTLSTSPSDKTLKNTVTVTPPNGFIDADLTNNSATDEDPIQATSTSSPNVLLVKRITRVNDLTTNDGKDLAAYTDIASYPYDDNTLDNPAPTPLDTDKWPTPLSQSLPGEVSAGTVKPGDLVEYTIYYLSAGSSSAKNVTVCDRIPSHQTFVPDTFNSLTAASNTAPASPPGDRGIEVSQGGINYGYTNIGDGDTARYYPPGSPLPSACTQSALPEDNGTIVLNLGDVPNATAPGAPKESYGFLRFRARVK
jgi:uncharacterized repeat protein (TIGR01451 family)